MSDYRSTLSELSHERCASFARVDRIPMRRHAYRGANIVSYGDGLADGLGDTYFYAHSQIDASLLYSVSPRVQLQVQGLNLNNAVFGFFQGTPSHDYSIQREYYGRTIYMGAKYGL